MYLVDGKPCAALTMLWCNEPVCTHPEKLSPIEFLDTTTVALLLVRITLLWACPWWYLELAALSSFIKCEIPSPEVSTSSLWSNPADVLSRPVGEEIKGALGVELWSSNSYNHHEMHRWDSSMEGTGIAWVTCWGRPIGLKLPL